MLPWWVWGVLLLASGVWVGFAWSNDLLRVFGGEWPDFQAWDQKDQLQLYEAACLWVDREPQLPLPRRAKAIYSALESHMLSGKSLPQYELDDTIAITLGEKEFPEPHAPMSRAGLLAMAESRGERPRFLYPAERVK